MNYKEINLAIMEDRDVDYSLIEKTEKFYQYLFNNKVAYFYANNLSTVSNKTEEWIISKGKELNEKYYKTIKEIKRICDKNNIEWVLYKTHKYIDEVVDGDIDLFVKEEDFQKFLDAFEREGFECEEDEPGKGKCEKLDFLVVEPHITISWRGGNYFNSNDLWKNLISLKYQDVEFKGISFEIETVALLAKVYFEPEYLDLQGLKFIQFFQKNYFSEKTLYSFPVFKNSLFHLYENLETLKDKAPFFLGNLHFLLFWSKAFLKHGVSFKVYLLHLIFFIYWKYRYLLINKLPFTHNWKKI